MPSTTDRLDVTTDADPAILTALIRQALVIGVFLLVAGLVGVLPGATRQIPGTGLRIAAVLTAGLTGAIVVTILLSTPAMGALVRDVVSGPPAVVEDLAGAARYGLVFVAVLVAYAGLEPVVVPLVGADSVWVYDVGFLGFALFPVVAIARRLHRCADPVSRELAESLAGSHRANTGDAEAPADDVG